MVTVSFPCLGAQSLNKELQLISCEAKWNASAIQSDALRRPQLAQVLPPVPGLGLQECGSTASPRQASRAVHGPGSQDSLPPAPRVTTGLTFSEAGGTQAAALPGLGKR